MLPSGIDDDPVPQKANGSICADQPLIPTSSGTGSASITGASFAMRSFNERRSVQAAYGAGDMANGNPYARLR